MWRIRIRRRQEDRRKIEQLTTSCFSASNFFLLAPETRQPPCHLSILFLLVRVEYAMLQWKFTLKSHCLNTAKAYCLLMLHIHFWAHMRVWPLLHWVTQYWRLMAFPLTRPVQVGILDLLLREGSTYTPSVFISELVTWPHLIGNYSKALGITASRTRNERRIRYWCITNVYDTLSDELVIISKTKLSTLWYRIKASLY